MADPSAVARAGLRARERQRAVARQTRASRRPPSASMREYTSSTSCPISSVVPASPSAPHTAITNVAERMPVPVTILPHRDHFTVRREPRLVLDPCAVPPGAIRRLRALQHAPLEPECNDRLVRCRRGALASDRSDPIARWKRVTQPLIWLAPRPEAQVLAGHTQRIESHELQPVARRALAAEHGPSDGAEVLCRAAVPRAGRDELAVERCPGRDGLEWCEQRCESRGQAAAVPRPPSHPPVRVGVDEQSQPVPLCLKHPLPTGRPTTGRGTEHRLRSGHSRRLGLPVVTEQERTLRGLARSSGATRFGG
jgi:hypothetical protein